MSLKDEARKALLFLALAYCGSSYAFDFDSCKSSLKDVLIDTNQLQHYGTDLKNSRESLINIGKYSAANQLTAAGLMVPIVRNSAIGLFTIGTFYDSLDLSKFAKKNAQNLYAYRMHDFYDDLEAALKYIESISPLVENASSRDDMKKISMELRKLKAQYRSCEK